MSEDRPSELTSAERDALVRAERTGNAFLHYRDGKGNHRIFVLPDDPSPVTIGRGSWVDIRITWHDGVSRVHCQLESAASDWVLVDDGLSRNGTYLNGERVQGRRRLSDQDIIGVGETQIVFAMPHQLDLETTAEYEDLRPRPAADPEEE